MSKSVWPFVVVAMISSVGVAQADVVACAPEGGWSRGHCARLHRTNPESWVRGSAAVDTATGVVTLRLQLETDSVLAGPCGSMTATLRDADGKTVATLEMGKEICRGGKFPGKSAIDDFALQRTLPLEDAQRVASVAVALSYMRTQGTRLPIKLEDVAAAIKIIAGA